MSPASLGLPPSSVDLELDAAVPTYFGTLLQEDQPHLHRGNTGTSSNPPTNVTSRAATGQERRERRYATR
ncbi:hypothetical protein BDV10DRAFT_185229 [Aspergillus recurvatus]